MNANIKEINFELGRLHDVIIDLKEENKKLKNKQLKYREKINSLMEENTDLKILIERIKDEIRFDNTFYGLVCDIKDLIDEFEKGKE